MTWKFPENEFGRGNLSAMSWNLEHTVCMELSVWLRPKITFASFPRGTAAAFYTCGGQSRNRLCQIF